MIFKRSVCTSLNLLQISSNPQGVRKCIQALIYSWSPVCVEGYRMPWQGLSTYRLWPWPTAAGSFSFTTQQGFVPTALIGSTNTLLSISDEKKVVKMFRNTPGSSCHELEVHQCPVIDDSSTSPWTERVLTTKEAPVPKDTLKQNRQTKRLLEKCLRQTRQSVRHLVTMTSSMFGGILVRLSNLKTLCWVSNMVMVALVDGTALPQTNS